MDFEAALEYLRARVSYEDQESFSYDEGNFDLQRFRKFLKDFGVDYKRVKFVHVGGSKGKGSVANFVARYLDCVGFRTGLFTSPYISDVREMFWVSGELMSEERFVKYVKEVKKFDGVTLFEIWTAFALKHFVEEGCEYVVLEVGLGGSLDTTNVVLPEVAALTTVEEEHLGILGNNLEEILDVKLGIRKEGVPFVVGYQSGEVRDLIEEKVRGAIFVEDVLGEGVEVGGINKAQRWNGGVAKVILQQLGAVDEVCFREVCENFVLKGRMEVREIDGKIVVFDMAHTVNSVRNLVESLEGKKLVFLVAMMKGKEVKEVLRLIGEVAEGVILTEAHEVRGYPAEGLLKFIDAEVVKDPQKAYEKALSGLIEDEVLVVTGSTFLIRLLS